MPTTAAARTTVVMLPSAPRAWGGEEPLGRAVPVHEPEDRDHEEGDDLHCHEGGHQVPSLTLRKLTEAA